MLWLTDFSFSVFSFHEHYRETTTSVTIMLFLKTTQLESLDLQSLIWLSSLISWHTLVWHTISKQPVLLWFRPPWIIMHWNRKGLRVKTRNGDSRASHVSLFLKKKQNSFSTHSFMLHHPSSYVTCSYFFASLLFIEWYSSESISNLQILRRHST